MDSCETSSVIKKPNSVRKQCNCENLIHLDSLQKKWLHAHNWGARYELNWVVFKYN